MLSWVDWCMSLCHIRSIFLLERFTRFAELLINILSETGRHIDNAFIQMRRLWLEMGESKKNIIICILPFKLFSTEPEHLRISNDIKKFSVVILTEIDMIPESGPINF